MLRSPIDILSKLNRSEFHLAKYSRETHMERSLVTVCAIKKFPPQFECVWGQNNVKNPSFVIKLVSIYTTNPYYPFL